MSIPPGTINIQTSYFLRNQLCYRLHFKVQEIFSAISKIYRSVAILFYFI